MSEVVQVGAPKADLLVPHTTLPDLLCHTITDKELDVLTDRSATVVGGICTAAFGVAASSGIAAVPAASLIISGDVASLSGADFAYLATLLAATPVFLLTLALAGHHLLKRKNHAEQIRARPKVPMRMRAANQR